MRGTLIGSDYLKQGDSVKFLEINTNISVIGEASEWLDTGSLMAVLTGSGITEFHFIHMGDDSQHPATNNPEYKFAKLLSSSCAQHNISYTEYEVAEGSITVPYIEDSDTKFILRQSYDNTAIIDSSYAADNFNFFELMSGSEYNPKIYFSSSVDDIVLDTFDALNISGSHPNAIIKTRYPNSTDQSYPKVYKFVDTSSASTDLQSLKDNLGTDDLIQEFINDDQNIASGSWSVIRGIDILYGDNLDILHLGGYKTTSFVPLNFGTIGYQSGTRILDKQSKLKYNSKSYNVSQQFYHTDEETIILKSDGSLVSGSQLSVNDEIKTIAFDFEVGTELSGSVIVSNDDFLDHYGYLSGITGSLQYVTSSLVEVTSQSADLPVIDFTFTDGTTMTDSPRASYLIEESGSNLTYFEFTNRFMVGDKICILNTTSNQIETKEVSAMSMNWSDTSEKIYNYDFEPYNYFLTNISPSKYFIAHNNCNYCGYSWSPCGSYWCANWCGECSFGGGRAK